MAAPTVIPIKPLPLASHPMLKQIIDAHIRGESARSIAKWCDPPTTHTTLARYFRSSVDPVLRRADQFHSILNPNNEGNRTVLDTQRQQTAATAPLQDVKTALVGAHILAIRENRIAQVQARHRLLNQVITERGEEMELCESCQRPAEDHPWTDDLRGCSTFHAVPGGSTGLIVRKLKANGVEYAVDTGVLSELREMEKHIAVELGQWQEGVSVSSLSVQIVCPWAPEGDAPQVRVSHDGGETIEATNDMFTDLGIIQKNG